MIAELARTEHAVREDDDMGPRCKWERCLQSDPTAGRAPHPSTGGHVAMLGIIVQRKAGVLGTQQKVQRQEQEGAGDNEPECRGHAVLWPMSPSPCARILPPARHRWLSLVARDFALVLSHLLSIANF